MQQTRLNQIFDLIIGRIETLFSNPWRRIALSIISPLLGFFVASAVVTTAGQDAIWDIVGAAIVLTLTETISQFVYRRQNQEIFTWRSLAWQTTNLFKLGITYSLFLEAFKLGS